MRDAPSAMRTAAAVTTALASWIHSDACRAASIYGVSMGVRTTRDTRNENSGARRAARLPFFARRRCSLAAGQGERMAAIEMTARMEAYSVAYAHAIAAAAG